VEPFRKSWMIGDMLDLVEMRRAELEEAEARWNDRLRGLVRYYADRTSVASREIRNDLEHATDQAPDDLEELVDQVPRIRGDED
jgi:hypothetical protein